MSLDTGAPVDLSEELASRLRSVGRAVTPREIGELWIFPPLEDVEDSAEFLLFTRLSGNGHRRLYSARMGRDAPGEPEEEGADAGDDAVVPAEPGTNGRRQRITDHGTIPADRVPRLVERFRRRVEAEGHEPVHVVVDGTPEKWRELLPEAAVNGNGAHGAAGGDGDGPGGRGTNDGGSGYGGSNGAEPAAA